ncbi:MAG: histidine--tRNA ligase [Spirochaetales bacterium]|nr:histidine--tRNA ligase [Spirochaetales bacterium]
MPNLVQPKVLKGFRDFLPETEISRKEIQTTLENTFKSFGMVPIDTPILEYTEVLLGKGSGETDKQIYRFQDHGKRDVAMRFDLTVPFARFMAANLNNLYLPFKRYHISKVWRGENTQRGRYREFTQCDFDIVGVDSPEADFEILSIMYESLTALGIPDIHIHISHRGIFNAFLEYLGVKENSAEILRIVDKLAKIGEEKVLEQLEELTNKEKASKILEYISADGSFDEILSKLEELSGGPTEGSKRLGTIRKMMLNCGIEDLFILNPSITRGLDYYTGIVYETFLDELPAIGSVCSGGRYNNLASIYSKTEMPGVGSSIGLDRLMAALEELGVSSSKKSLTKVLIMNMDDSLKGHYFNIAAKLRKAGINTEVFLEQKKMKNQFTFAERKNIPFAIIIGEDEYKENKVSVKNLETRENFNMTNIEDAIKIIGGNKE